MTSAIDGLPPSADVDDHSIRCPGPSGIGLLSPRLRVLVVNPFGELGGAEIYLLRLLDATQRLDVRVLLLRDGPLRAELERRGVPVDVLPVGSAAGEVARAAWWVRCLLRRQDPEVVLANGIKAQAVVGPAAALAGYPVVWIKHDHSFDRGLTPPLARLARRVVATAEDVAASSARSDVVLIQPSRPAGPWPRPAARAAVAGHGLDWRPGRHYLVMTTRLTPYKGVDVAVRALSGAPGWELVVLGGEDPVEPGEPARLRRLAATAGVADRVHLLGHVPDAARLLSAFDALAVLTRDGGPRTPGREGFGMAAMEAALAGLPVIAPDDGGAVALRTRDGAGLLADPTDPESVTAALVALSNPVTRHRMGTVALARAGRLATGEEAATRLVEVLCDAASRPGAGLATGRPVSVVTPVLNEAAVLDRLVPPLLEQLTAEDEMVLVDSGSVDGTRELLRDWQRRDHRIRLLEVERCTIGQSRNLGVAAARHDLLLCIDAGCRPDPGWVDRMRAALSAPSAPDLVVGGYRVAVRPERPFEAALAGVAFPDPSESRGSGPLVRAWAASIGARFDRGRVDCRSVGFRREAFETAGGFPPHLFTAEDEAFGRAIRDSGGTSALLTDATVTWWQRDSVPAAFRQFRGYGRGGVASRSLRLLGIDAARLVGYLLIGGGWASGRARPRRLAAAATFGLLAVPAHRVVRRKHPARALVLLPVAQLVKDGGKLTGVLEALLCGRTGPLPRPGGVRQ